MIEVVFSDSAYGSIRQARGFGAGKFRSGAIGVILDGPDPSQEDIRRAQQQAEDRFRREWEQAIPLGSRPEDIYCFDLAWSAGPISENHIGQQRQDVLKQLHSIWPMEDTDQKIDAVLQKASASLSALLRRSESGESIRIWYSHNPDELCGLHWLLAQLRPLTHRGDVFGVKLPLRECTEENTLVSRNGWGEICPGEWGRYVSRQKLLPPVFISVCAGKWVQLQQENAPLRIQLNGQLHSAPEDIYDSFILREIEAQKDIFPESLVIGNILGKYQLGIGDGWIALRIEKMIQDGILEILEDAPEGYPIYRRTLQKCR